MQLHSLHKSNQIFWLTLKVCIILASAFFIFNQLKNHKGYSSFSISTLYELGIMNLLLIISFTITNWFLEVWKWKFLTQPIRNNSFQQSVKEALASLTFSLLTPNRIGEYGAKAIFYNTTERKKIMGLNAIGNSYQLLVTLVFGSVSWLYIGYSFFEIISSKLNFTYLAIGIVFLILLTTFFNQKIIKLFQSIKRLIKLHSKKRHIIVFTFSLLRFLVFSHQFYFILLLFGSELTYLNGLVAISSVYFISSLIPMLSLFDVVVKSSIAILILSWYQIPSLSALSCTLLMWCLNFVIPAIIGMYFIWIFNPKQENE